MITAEQAKLSALIARLTDDQKELLYFLRDKIVASSSKGEMGFTILISDIPLSLQYSLGEVNRILERIGYKVHAQCGLVHFTIIFGDDCDIKCCGTP